MVQEMGRERRLGPIREGIFSRLVMSFWATKHAEGSMHSAAFCLFGGFQHGELLAFAFGRYTHECTQICIQAFLRPCLLRLSVTVI